MADPAAEVERIAAFAGLGWDRDPPAELPHSRHTLTPPAPGKWRAHEAELAPLLERLAPLAERSRAALDHVPRPRPARPPAPGPARCAASSTTTFSELLDELGASALVSTYQTGKLVVLREAGGALNTHFRDLESPMGIAVDGRPAGGRHAPRP